MKTRTFTNEERVISKATLARMPLYLHFLQEESSKGAQYISSTVIAQNISVSSVLVRKDLALVSSEAGRPRLGFAISRLIVDIEKFLANENTEGDYNAIYDIANKLIQEKGTENISKIKENTQFNEILSEEELINTLFAE